MLQGFSSALPLLLEFIFFLCVILIGIVAAGFSLSFFDVPFVPTRRKYFPAIEQALLIVPGDVVYELGSGTGALTRALARMHPEARFIGVEINPTLHLYALLRARFSRDLSNVSFRRESFYKTDLRDCTKVYAYLLHSVMDSLLPKLERETPRDLVVSRAFQFSALTPSKTVRITQTNGAHGQHLLYVYELDA